MFNLTVLNKHKSSAPRGNRPSNVYETKFKTTSKAATIKLLREEQKEKEEPKEKTKLLNETILKKEKLGFWFNIEMLLQDIDVQHEKFEIFTWFDVYWKDNKNEKLELLFEENKSEHTSLCYTDLNDEIKKSVPFRRNFLLNAVDLEYLECFIRKWDKNKVDNIYILHFVFKATINERFELDSFPFDAQFLNLKIRFNDNLFYCLSSYPLWISLYDNNKLIEIFNFNVTDSIESIWNVESPIIDFRENKGNYNIPFHLIRLRVVRNPSFYILNGIIPLFLAVSCSFAQIAIDDNNLSDKLEYVVTLLLTVAAFQYAFSADLPQTSETTYIDYYILCSYLILSCMVAQIATNSYNYLLLSLYATIWLFSSLFFVYKWLHKINPSDWRKRSIEEFKEWDLNSIKNDYFHKPSIYDIKGTKDVSDPSFEHF